MHLGEDMRRMSAAVGERASERECEGQTKTVGECFAERRKERRKHLERAREGKGDGRPKEEREREKDEDKETHGHDLFGGTTQADRW